MIWRRSHITSIMRSINTAISLDETVFVCDDYGLGENDESVYKSDYGFIKVDDYKQFRDCIKHLL